MFLIDIIVLGNGVFHQLMLVYELSVILLIKETFY